MGFVDLKKVFFPTEEEIKAQEKLFKDLHDLLVWQMGLLRRQYKRSLGI